ncbi:MAG TPA: hypothetical protein VEA80_19180 [Vitreimonas sp.]|uniref:hypothetical protein n=1 Tax=Vitreimonas sp. TaxID=3069702 RepID=UPI002D490F03|nr:hypothetical protein [Vitreimonas sp.]HYD89612.1 hypothetical protein [Vitreimonas sp.]
MRLGIFAFLVLLCCAAPAAAQTAITLRAEPAPIVDAEINGRAVRLEVDLRFPSGLALSAAAARRLRVRQLPLMQIGVGIEGSDATLRGRIARPRILFEGRAARAFAGVFGAPVTTRADGVIGPGALPYDIITIVLNPEPPGARDIVLPLEDADDWTVRTQIGGQQFQVNFNVANSASVFNRTASRALDATGDIPAAGAVAEMPLILGLRTMMQPVETELSVFGLPVRPAYARTNAPLLGATEDDAIVVRGEAEDAPPPILVLGRSALSRCASISVDRRSRRMTLRCAV